MSQKIIYIDSQLRNDADTPQDFNVNLSALQRDQGFAKCDKLKCQLVDIAIDNIWDLQGCYFTLVEGDVGCDVGDITETFINLYTDSADKYTPTLYIVSTHSRQNPHFCRKIIVKSSSPSSQIVVKCKENPKVTPKSS